MGEAVAAAVQGAAAGDERLRQALDLLKENRTAAWFKTCQFQVTPEIDRALMVKGFLVSGVTLI